MQRDICILIRTYIYTEIHIYTHTHLHTYTHIDIQKEPARGNPKEVTRYIYISYKYTYTHIQIYIQRYEVATISTLLKIIGLFRRISSLL